MGKLLSTDDTVYNDIKRTASTAGEVADRIRAGEGTMGKILSTNDVIYVDLRKMIANATEISDRLRSGEGVMGRLLAKEDPLADELEKSVAAFRKACESFDGETAMDRANELLVNLNTVAARLKDGEGTLGRLVNDPSLYDEVQGVTKDVRQVIDNYRDTTPISTFGSLIMGGL